jgi:serine/threonine-protein phosphatase 5
MEPANKDAREKYESTMKQHKLKVLSAAIFVEDKKVEVNVADIVVESSYTGPKFDKVEEIDSAWVESLLEWQKDNKNLHLKYASMIILKARDLFEKDKSLVHITIPEDQEVTVCGDIHGQYYDLLNIWKINGIPSETNPYLFNGDFIDRGSFSVEVIIAMLSWKVAFPNHFFMSRGNHESKNLNKMYGFEGEVKHKYNETTYDLFSDMFCYLPIAHCINRKIFIVHGGLFSKDGVKISEIEAVNRIKEPGDEGIMCECMWSDPCD